MKFDQLVESLLLEMPHIAFNSNGKILKIDLKMEDFQNNYDGFLNHFLNLYKKSGSAQQDFVNELKENKVFNLWLEKLFQIDFEKFQQDFQNLL